MEALWRVFLKSSARDTAWWLSFIGAVACGHVEVVKLLIGHGVNPDFRVNNVRLKGLALLEYVCSCPLQAQSDTCCTQQAGSHAPANMSCCCEWFSQHYPSNKLRLCRAELLKQPTSAQIKARYTQVQLSHNIFVEVVVAHFYTIQCINHQ